MTTKTIGEAMRTNTQKLYIGPGEFWVGEDNGSLWLFPAKEQGWRERVPFKGLPGALESAEASMAIGTGYPEWERPQ